MCVCVCVRVCMYIYINISIRLKMASIVWIEHTKERRKGAQCDTHKRNVDNETGDFTASASHELASWRSKGLDPRPHLSNSRVGWRVRDSLLRERWARTNSHS